MNQPTCQTDEVDIAQWYTQRVRRTPTFWDNKVISFDDNSR